MNNDTTRDIIGLVIGIAVAAGLLHVLPDWGWGSWAIAIFCGLGAFGSCVDDTSEPESAPESAPSPQTSDLPDDFIPFLRKRP